MNITRNIEGEQLSAQHLFRFIEILTFKAWVNLTSAINNQQSPDYD